MRLGAKKRVIYQLVGMGLGHLALINGALKRSDITSTYVRDIIRLGIESGDFAGDVDRNFNITKYGDEILKKAPFPSNWDDYRDLLPQKDTPDTEASGAIRGGARTLPGM